MLTLPLSLVGGLWLLYLLGYNLSVAFGVGFIALAGVAVAMILPPDKDDAEAEAEDVEAVEVTP